MWVTFIKDFDFYPDKWSGRVTVAYKAGQRANVTRQCARRAFAAGALLVGLPSSELEDVRDAPPNSLPVDRARRR